MKRLLAIILVLPSCETITYYPPEGGKTVIERPSEKSLELAARIAELTALKYAVDAQK